MRIDTGGGDYAEGNIDKRQGTFVDNSTVHGDIIGEQTTIMAPGLSSNDRANRQRMIKQVRQFWVEGVLQKSLYQGLLIALNLQTDPQAVSFAGPRLAAQRDQAAHALPAETSIAQVYQEANQRLLILGAPGAGKTTLLLDLARTLLDQAEHDETQPIPVVFNLSSWAQQRLPL
jgi:Cdc6-like AAA superfamily ATPase